MENKEPQIIDQGQYPVLPLRDIVVFPGMVVPLFVGREKSINALNSVMDKYKKIILAAKKVMMLTIQKIMRFIKSVV